MKLFFVLLGLLLLLFAVGIGLGARGEEEGKVDPGDHPLLEKLGGFLGARTAVDPATVETSCRAGAAFVFSGTCAAAVPAADAEVRTLKLRLTGGERAELRFTPRGGAALAVRKRLDPGDELSLTVPAEGGDLLLTCFEVGEACRFEMVE
jgi:hypothetical protein